MTIFTLAEKNLMIIYNPGSRLDLMAELGNMLTFRGRLSRAGRV